MPLAYADDVDIIGRSDREVAVAFAMYWSSSKWEEDKISSAGKDSSIGESVEIDGYNFKVVKDFVYLGSSINIEVFSTNPFGNSEYL